MLTVSELATKAHAPAHVVRYYISIGLLKPAGQLQNGYRYFKKQDATRLRFIRLAKLLGFTLKEIKQITLHADSGNSPCEDVRTIIKNRIQENREKIQEMMLLQVRMEETLERWSEMPNSIPDEHSVCHLIESIDFGTDEVAQGFEQQGERNE